MQHELTWEQQQYAYGAYVVFTLSLSKPRYLHNFTDITYYSPTVKTGLFGGFISGINRSKYLMDYPFVPTNVKYFADQPTRVIGNISVTVRCNNYPVASFEDFVSVLWDYFKLRVELLFIGNEPYDTRLKEIFA
jgi:hypothetical protein